MRMEFWSSVKASGEGHSVKSTIIVMEKSKPIIKQGTENPLEGFV